MECLAACCIKVGWSPGTAALSGKLDRGCVIRLAVQPISQASQAGFEKASAPVWKHNLSCDGSRRPFKVDAPAKRPHVASNPNWRDNEHESLCSEEWLQAMSKLEELSTVRSSRVDNRPGHPSSLMWIRYQGRTHEACARFPALYSRERNNHSVRRER
ncbi:hypothetical protein Micbo1qcDRAFT_171330 [Microdochium bolleyi]|uniref:Uncharacterized protein n=1 Tax=Microdochium bolleyi TaxID=196109 RepID=A0A136JKM7_9PEZI|nr:hypothetical protein Micbo1qcDRAFT_171330 [Microdochium bolleyi]